MSFRVAASAACFLIAVEARAAEAPLADIVAAEPTGAGIDVTVPTGGCTKKADFDVAAKPAAQGAAKVEIRRLKNDYCKGFFPDGLKLTFTWEDLKLAAGTKLAVANPVAGHSAQPSAISQTSIAAPKKVKKRCKRSGRHARRCKHYGHSARAGAHSHHVSRAHRSHARRHHHRRHRARCHF